MVNMQHNPAGYKLMIRVGYDYQGWENMHRGCEGGADTNPFLRADIEALALAIMVITDKEDYQKYIKIQSEEHSAAELGLR